MVTLVIQDANRNEWMDMMAWPKSVTVVLTTGPKVMWVTMIP